MSRRIFALFALVLSGRAQQTAPPSSGTVLHAAVQEVLLDFVARDKHHKLIANLRPQDIEILEDGVPQKLRSFHYRGAGNAPGETTPAASVAGARPAYNPLREINVVSLVFDGMGLDSRRRATSAAKAFLGAELGANTYAGVFAMHHRLNLLQQYTNDLDLLNQAVDRVAGSAPETFAKDMQTQAMLLNSLSSGRGGFRPLEPGSAEERGPIGIGSHLDAAAAGVERQMASLTIAVLSNQVGNSSIDALEQLIRGQAQLRGRKTVIYFSEGLILPPGQPERYRALISDSNRSNVAFYTVDASGLDTVDRINESRALNAAIHSSDPDAADSPTNYQENLRYLAEDTGGAAIANMNDMTAPLRRVMEEVRAHYEVSYAPSSSNYDGHFRATEVRAMRPGVNIQSRKGYFALPMLGGEPVAPFEFAALTALDRDPPPQAFEFHAAVLRFQATAAETECRAVFSVPSRALYFAEDNRSKLFRLHVSFLALIKDDRDQVVSKISRDLQFQAPAAKRPEFERGETAVTLHLSLPPGRYHMQAVALDQENQAASIRKIAFFVPSAGRIGLSDLVFVRSVQPDNGARDAMDPLSFPGGQVTPDLNPAVPKSPDAVESLYFVLYPSARIGAQPDVRITLSHNGKLVTAVRESVPAAEADGSIRVLSRIGLGALDTGPYEVQVTATQGAATASGSAVIDIP
ncbi:MAG TPA: VWA domain-containing protein [Bryobacteraceae bacterium]|jgi:VWFA-related protein|nr:VWA domain-containing protein [Bryobacteraceae bacterium]